MAFSKSQALLLLVLAGTTMLAAGAGNCERTKKITLQNLCDFDLHLVADPVAASEHILPPNYMLRHRTHAEFAVCSWSGHLYVAGNDAAADLTTELHIAAYGGAWYKASNHQVAGGVRVSVTPHSKGGLHGHCPAVGCGEHGQCFASAVAGGDCGNVDELKVVYYRA